MLFLIQVRVDVNSRTKDGEEATPLHLAVKIGDDFIVRNLTLAGAEVDAVDKTGQTALHCAAERDLAEITRILLQNGWKPDLLDEGYELGWAPSYQNESYKCSFFQAPSFFVAFLSLFRAFIGCSFCSFF